MTAPATSHGNARAVRRVVLGLLIAALWIGVSFLTSVWISLSDALGQEVGREPPWRLDWFPTVLAASWGALVAALVLAAVLAIGRRRSQRSN